jgi:hypothetical protein
LDVHLSHVPEELEIRDDHQAAAPATVSGDVRLSLVILGWDILRSGQEMIILSERFASLLKTIDQFFYQI